MMYLLFMRRFELEGPNSEAMPEGAEEDAEAAAAFVRGHKETTAEIRALCSDLQVLGRSEFKQLLKWCVPCCPPQSTSPWAVHILSLCMTTWVFFATCWCWFDLLLGKDDMQHVLRLLQ